MIIIEDYKYTLHPKNRMAKQQCEFCDKIFVGRYRKDRLSCGCQRGVTHGEERGRRKSPELRAWHHMKQRCLNQNNSDYANYGGRGITVHSAWIGSYENFLQDVGRRPGPDYSIDRIDVNGNYEPGNVRWATKKEQGRNKRNNRIIEYQGNRLTASEWIARMNISKTHFYRLLRSGRSAEDIINNYLEDKK